jgi:hypothetical protein
VGLKDQKRLFFEKRATCDVLVKNHAFRDHPERGFSQPEIIQLVRNGAGTISENNSQEAIDGSVLFSTKDDFGRACKFSIRVTEVEIDGGPTSSGGTKRVSIVVFNAFRKVSHETKKN